MVRILGSHPSDPSSSPGNVNLLDQFGKSNYFSSLDLASEYLQIPMIPEDAHKTAFHTRKGIFQFTRISFGLSYAGSTFQRMANAIFDDLISEHVVIIYLDTFEYIQSIGRNTSKSFRRS